MKRSKMKMQNLSEFAMSKDEKKKSKGGVLWLAALYALMHSASAANSDGSCSSYQCECLEGTVGGFSAGMTHTAGN